MYKFYCVIIGTEILNGRREDKHFAFLKSELASLGYELSGSFVIKDDEDLLRSVFSLFKEDKNLYMFSFGGIGATPDDLTRQIVAEVFTNAPLKRNKEAVGLLEESFKDKTYPHRIKMADLPVGCKLLTNVVNKAPGFSLENRLFFMPGFPSMSHPMSKEALSLYVKKNETKLYSFNIIAHTRENDIVSFMNALPSQIELSSLPRIISDDEFKVEILLRSSDEDLLQAYSKKLENYLISKDVKFENLTKKDEK